MNNAQRAQQVADKLGLTLATVTDLLEHGWTYVEDDRPGRWESFVYRVTKS